MKSNDKTRKKIMGILLITGSVILGLLFIIVIGSVITTNFVYTPQFKGIDGKKITDSVAEFERVKLGGNSQAVLIRGKDINNPAVIFLHMGPGLTETGMFRNLLPELENDFTMVYLDMRGGGKSYSFFNKAEDFNTERLSEDIFELAVYIKNKLNKEKIIVMGHSFGAPFGLIAASKHPEDFAMYIGIGQPVDPPECDKLSHGYTIQLAKSESNNEAVKELGRIDGYWNTTDISEYMNAMMILKKWVGFYGGQIQGEKGPTPFILRNTMCHEYTIFDWVPIFAGMSFCGNASGEIMLETDMREIVQKVEIPFIIMEGRHDFNTFPSLVEEYYEMMEAPMKKIFWFEKSAHFPHFEEKNKFLDIMINEIRPLVLGS